MYCPEVVPPPLLPISKYHILRVQKEQAPHRAYLLPINVSVRAKTTDFQSYLQNDWAHGLLLQHQVSQDSCMQPTSFFSKSIRRAPSA